MIGMICPAMACDEHDQQFAGMRHVPRSYYDIKGRPDEHLWMEACDKEIKKMFEMGTFSIVDETDIPANALKDIAWKAGHIALFHSAYSD